MRTDTTNTDEQYFILASSQKKRYTLKDISHAHCAYRRPINDNKTDILKKYLLMFLFLMSRDIRHILDADKL